MAEDESGRLDPADVQLLPGSEPFTLVPLINDILRTRYCVPRSIFLVEGLQDTPVSRSGRWRAVTLLLGDGVLCVQSLLSGDLHRFVETGDIAVGSYVRLDEFSLKFKDLMEEDLRGQPDGDGPSQMVFLAVEDLVVVGWNESLRKRFKSESRDAVDDLEDEMDLDLEERELEYEQADADLAQDAQVPMLDEEKDADEDEDEDDAAIEDAFEQFESRTFPSRNSTRSRDPADPAVSVSGSLSGKPTSSLVALPRDWHDAQTPLKLTTLRSIPRLPYAQNWSCNILAIIVALSPVEPSHLPPHKQRTARLADPSTEKQIHLTVFLDPEDFAPKVGSAVLLVGVKNHRFDGGSLKKYASDKAPGTGQWWYENPTDLKWCDCEGLLAWFRGVQSTYLDRGGAR